MRLGTCLLFEGRTLQGAHPKLAYFCSAPVEGFYAAVDRLGSLYFQGHPQVHKNAICHMFLMCLYTVLRETPKRREARLIF